MRLGAVVLADPACGRCPRRIEVAQGGIAHAIGPGVVPHHVLHVELGAAVGVDRVLRVIVRDGHLPGLAVGGAGGGEDDVGHAC